MAWIIDHLTKTLEDMKAIRGEAGVNEIADQWRRRSNAMPEGSPSRDYVNAALNAALNRVGMYTKGAA